MTPQEVQSIVEVLQRAADPMFQEVVSAMRADYIGRIIICCSILALGCFAQTRAVRAAMRADEADNLPAMISAVACIVGLLVACLVSFVFLFDALVSLPAFLVSPEGATIVHLFRGE